MWMDNYLKANGMVPDGYWMNKKSFAGHRAYR